jgi:hypothetical protein
MADRNPVADLAAERAKRARLPPGGSDGHDGGMPPDELKNRLEALEKRVDADVRELRADIKSLTGAVNEVSGKVSQLPTLLQIAMLMITTMVSLAGLVFAVAKAMK